MSVKENSLLYSGIVFFAIIGLGCTNIDLEREEHCPLDNLEPDQARIISGTELDSLKDIDPSACAGLNGVVGTYNNVPLVVIYSCEDLCPENEELIIFMDVIGSECGAHGGVLKHHNGDSIGGKWGVICEVR